MWLLFHLNTCRSVKIIVQDFQPLGDYISDFSLNGLEAVQKMCVYKCLTSSFPTWWKL